MGTGFAYLLSMDSLLKTFKSSLALSCEAIESFVYLLGGCECVWCVSVGGLSQGNAFSSCKTRGSRR